MAAGRAEDPAAAAPGTGVLITATSVPDPRRLSWLRIRLHGCRSPAEDPAAAAPAVGVLITATSVPDPAEDPAAHHQLTDPAADHPRLAPDPAALVAGRAEDPAAAAPAAGCPGCFYDVLFGMTVKPIFPEKHQLFVKPLFYE